MPALVPGSNKSCAIRLAHQPGGPLAALEGGALARRFRRWQGISGRSYVFSVFAAEAEEPLPDYAEAVLLIVGEAAGSPFIAAALETGTLPALALARAQQMARELAGPVEFHFHLMAETSAARRALIADLTMECRQESEFTRAA